MTYSKQETRLILVFHTGQEEDREQDDILAVLHVHHYQTFFFRRSARCWLNEQSFLLCSYISNTLYNVFPFSLANSLDNNPVLVPNGVRLRFSTDWDLPE